MGERPEPNSEGKIPCIVCDYKGRRKNMITKELYICEKCQGSKWREPPIGYRSDAQIIKDTNVKEQRERELDTRSLWKEQSRYFD